MARVADVLKGSFAGEEITVVLAAPQFTGAATHQKPATNRTLFFLKPAEPGSNYYYTVALAGLIEDTPNGLVTPRDPSQSTITEQGTRDAKKTFDELVKEVKAEAR